MTHLRTTPDLLQHQCRCVDPYGKRCCRMVDNPDQPICDACEAQNHQGITGCRMAPGWWDR